jgi:glycosidase
VTNPPQGKAVVYQVFTRLFGNKNRTNKPWGSLNENGVGKFADFNDTALAAIKTYGTTHVWYTGVPHHALINEYPGMSSDHPEVVKGRAGSPYAVKDYYNVNPDLATNPANRLAEFEALIARTHQHGMKVIIDIVPNHVARQYHSTSAPDEARDFGADDNTQVEYQRDNNFYYLPNESFAAPDFPEGFEPLGGEFNAELTGHFIETPAKWTGNGSTLAKPSWDDWFETVKINYGVTPDGHKEFDQLPADFRNQDLHAHFEFWQTKNVPNSWLKFRDIALYWLAKGVDGFRFDMAEMVPVEFWSYLNSAIHHANPQAEVIAEVYQPNLYRDYLHLGKMNYLYDKVDLYDSLKGIIQHKAGAHIIDDIQTQLEDIDANLIRFLENHDEQRIPSPEFAGSAEKAWPAMVVTALMGQGPTMLYFGQAQGEKAESDLGFGRASRTTIFDYAGVPAHQDWMNDGLFDGGLLSSEQKALNEAYQRLLTFSANEASLQGSFYSLHAVNLSAESSYDDRSYSFVRQHGDEWAIVIVNFDNVPKHYSLVLPAELANGSLKLEPKAMLTEQINGANHQQPLLHSTDNQFKLNISCPAYGALVYKR